MDVNSIFEEEYDKAIDKAIENEIINGFASIIITPQSQFPDAVTDAFNGLRPTYDVDMQAHSLIPSNLPGTLPMPTDVKVMINRMKSAVVAFNDQLQNATIPAKKIEIEDKIKAFEQAIKQILLGFQ